MVLSVPSMHLSDSSGADAASRRLNMDRWGRALRRKPIVGSILSLFVLLINKKRSIKNHNELGTYRVLVRSRSCVVTFHLLAPPLVRWYVTLQ